MCLSRLACGQSAAKLRIQRIELRDTLLVHHIERYLAEQRDNPDDPERLVERGYGYIILRVQDSDEQSTIARRYDLYFALSSFRDDALDISCPLFYTYVAGRLVLIEVSNLNHILGLTFSTKAKRQMRRRVDHFLAKRTRQVGRDMQGNKVVFKHHRIEWLRFDSEKVIFVKKDGSVVIRRGDYFLPVK